MIDPSLGAGETAISYTDQFLDGAVKKIDKVFGKGYAAANPSLVQAYLNACALNMSAFLNASIALQASGELDAMLDDED